MNNLLDIFNLILEIDKARFNLNRQDKKVEKLNQNTRVSVETRKLAFSKLNKISLELDEKLQISLSNLKKICIETNNKSIIKNVDTLLNSKDSNTQIELMSNIAYELESNGDPKEHANKLRYVFDSLNGAISYVLSFQNENKSNKHFFHDSCLFELPEGECNVGVWRKFAQKHLLDGEFRYAFKQAADVERFILDKRFELYVCDQDDNVDVNENVVYISKKNEGLLSYSVLLNKKLRVGDICAKDLSLNFIPEELEATKYPVFEYILKSYNFPVLKLNIEAVKKKKNELKSAIKAWKEIKRKRGENTDPVNEAEYRELTSKVSNLRVELAKLHYGIEFNVKLSLDLMIGFSEEVLLKNCKAYGPLIKFGLTKKNIDVYNKLPKVNSDKNIPNITICGSEINYKGYYLIKLKEDDYRAAIAGKLTTCCQFIGGAGTKCAEHSISSEYGAVYMLFEGDVSNPSRDDKVLAQSWTWVAEKNKICFDSIESNSVEDDDMVRGFWNVLAKKMRVLGVEHINVGIRSGIGSSPASIGISRKNIASILRPKDTRLYGDAADQNTLYSNSKEFEAVSLASEGRKQELIQFFKKNSTNDKMIFNIIHFIHKGKYTLHLMSDLGGKEPKHEQRIYLQLDNNKDNISVSNRASPLKLYENNDKKHVLYKIIDNGNVSSGTIDWLHKFPSNNSLDEFYKIEESLLGLLGITVNTNVCTILKKSLDDIVLCEYKEEMSQLYKTINIRASEEELLQVISHPKYSLSMIGENSYTVFMIACMHGYERVIDACLNLKVDIDDVNHLGLTALHLASKFGREYVVNNLVAIGANYEIKECKYRSPAWYAFANGYINIAEKLKGCINELDRDDSDPLCRSIQLGKKDVVEKLIRIKGILIDTPICPHLSISFMNGQFDVFKFLLDIGGVNVNDPEYPSLQMACFMGEKDIVEKLLNYKGVDVNIVDRNGLNPLISAYLNNHFNIVDRLLDLDEIDVNICSQYGTVLDLALAENNYSIVARLLKKKSLNIDSSLMFKLYNYSGCCKVLIDREDICSIEKDRFVARWFTWFTQSETDSNVFIETFEADYFVNICLNDLRDRYPDVKERLTYLDELIKFNNDGGILEYANRLLFDSCKNGEIDLINKLIEHCDVDVDYAGGLTKSLLEYSYDSENLNIVNRLLDCENIIAPIKSNLSTLIFNEYLSKGNKARVEKENGQGSFNLAFDILEKLIKLGCEGGFDSSIVRGIYENLLGENKEKYKRLFESLVRFSRNNYCSVIFDDIVSRKDIETIKLFVKYDKINKDNVEKFISDRLDGYALKDVILFLIKDCVGLFNFDLSFILVDSKVVESRVGYKKENNLLHHFSNKGEAEVFQVLLSLDIIDVNLLNTQKHSPLSIAVARKDKVIVKILLKYKDILKSVLNLDDCLAFNEEFSGRMDEEINQLILSALESKARPKEKIKF